VPQQELGNFGRERVFRRQTRALDRLDRRLGLFGPFHDHIFKFNAKIISLNEKKKHGKN
jgi:hypothetical protein